MDTRVDHQPAGAPGIEGERAEFLVGIGVESKLAPQRLGIESPAFRERRLLSEAAELRQCAILPRQRKLKMMAGNALVQLQHFAGVARPRRKVRSIQVDDTGAPSIARRRRIFRRGAVWGGEGS